MKKRLLAIVLVLMLALTLLPTAAFADDAGSTDLGTITKDCKTCKRDTTWNILAYIPTPISSKPDPVYHWIRVQCTICNLTEEFSPGSSLGKHTGGDDSAVTCTTGKICEKCGAQYGILGHIWGEWQSNGGGTHTRSCKRDGCDAVDTANCGGDSTATCVNLGTCTDCGGQYYGGHNFANNWKSDADTHWKPCLNGNCVAKKDEAGHWFVPGNVHLKSEATCISPAVYYTNCASCYYKGTETYSDPYNWINKNNHDGGTEVKNAKAATCTEKGYTGDTYCKGCGEKLSDGKDIPATGHDLKHTDAKRATSFVAGNTEYWHCEDCSKYYADADAKTEITQASTVIPATGRKPAPTTPAASVSSPKTGDPGVLLYAGMALLSLTGCAWLRRKEK